MLFFRLCTAFFLLTFPIVVSAQVAFSELLWMGSDVSTADEWIELYNVTDKSVDLTGWSIHYRNSSGQEVPMLTIPEGSIAPGEYFLISNYPEENSRLTLAPDLVTSAVSLPNTNLHLTLFDAAHVAVDEADDGSGVPAAGVNSPLSRASMARVDFLASGRAPENWQSSTISVNIDPGSELLATPGIDNALSGGSSSSSSSCADDLAIEIDVQSGELSGIGSTTLNVQAVAVSGSLSGLGCNFDFGDGFTSSSCNPGPHKFDQVGTFLLSLRVINRCGEELVDTLSVTVTDSSHSGVTTLVPYDGASMLLFSVLPNPNGADTHAEILILKNLTDRITTLAGWKMEVETTKKRTSPLSGSLGAHSELRIFSSEATFSLPNTEATVRLIDPLGGVRSTVYWKKADEGRSYFPGDLREHEVSGTVQAVLSGTRFIIEASPRVREKTGLDVLPIQLADVAELEGKAEDEPSFALSSAMWLRALIEKKKVTIEIPEGETWTADQFLRARVFVHGNYAVIDDGLLKGYLVTDGTEHDFLTAYTALEDTAKKEKRGLWEFVHSLQSSSMSSTRKTPMSKVDLTRYEGLRISEVYASPFPQRDFPVDADALLAEEWIELWNTGSGALDLTHWTLAVGEKSVELPAGMVIEPSAFALLRSTDLHFQLRNSGHSISLLSPDGELLRTLQYPSLKHGYAYAFHPESRSHCVSVMPTPFAANTCDDPVPVDRSKAAKKAAITRKENLLAGYVGLYRRDVESGAEYRITKAASDWSVWTVFGSVLLSLTFGLLGGLIPQFVGRTKA